MATRKYRTDAEAWQATVAVAFAIAKKAGEFQRDYLPDERRRVESLIAKAERALGLVGIPREPAELVAYYHRDGKQYGAVDAPTSPTTATAGEHIADDDDGHGDRVDRPTPAAARPDPADDDVPRARSYMSAADLATHFGVSETTLAKQLERWRRSHLRSWEEFKKPKCRKPRIVYVVSEVMPIIDELRLSPPRSCQPIIFGQHFSSPLNGPTAP
jgi:hypothetical protein